MLSIFLIPIVLELYKLDNDLEKYKAIHCPTFQSELRFVEESKMVQNYLG